MHYIPWNGNVYFAACRKTVPVVIRRRSENNVSLPPAKRIATMSRILVLAAATALLGLTACNKPAEETVPPPAAAPAPEAAMPADRPPLRRLPWKSRQPPHPRPNLQQK